MAGRRIDDYSSPWGGKGKSSVFPDGPHKVKEESSADGFGALMEYEDTTEAIKTQQMIGKKKVKENPMKPHYRN